jgi:hypothetical protein
MKVLFRIPSSMNSQDKLGVPRQQSDGRRLDLAGAAPRLWIGARPPPSAASTAPVTNDASSEARKTQHAAISDGCLFMADFVAKVPKCRAINFPHLDQTSPNRRSM